MMPNLDTLDAEARDDVVETVRLAITGTVIVAHPAAPVEPTQGVALVIDDQLPWGKVYLVHGQAVLDADLERIPPEAYNLHGTSERDIP